MEKYISDFHQSMFLTWVPTVMLGIEEMPALDFGFLFLALAFSSIFFRWLKGTTPLEEKEIQNLISDHKHNSSNQAYTINLNKPKIAIWFLWLSNLKGCHFNEINICTVRFRVRCGMVHSHGQLIHNCLQRLEMAQ